MRDLIFRHIIFYSLHDYQLCGYKVLHEAGKIQVTFSDGYKLFKKIVDRKK